MLDVPGRWPSRGSWAIRPEGSHRRGNSMTVKDADAIGTGSDEAATAEPTVDRRGFMVLGAGGLLAAVLQSARAAAAQSAQRRGTLVIALDISDATGLDPVRVYQYSNP